MNISKEVITDLFPLYVANECSPDSRALVEQYLRQNPTEAEQLKRMTSLSMLSQVPRSGGAEEMRALCEARGRLRRESWVRGLAIFFSLLPFSFLATGERIYWLFQESAWSAAVYAIIGALCWTLFFVQRSRSKILSNP